MRQCVRDLEAIKPAGYRRRILDHAELTAASSSNPFDARGPFLLSLFMTLVGYSVLVALPAINSAWVDQLGFSEVQVNRVASADLLGLFIGAVLTSLLIRTWQQTNANLFRDSFSDRGQWPLHSVCRLSDDSSAAPRGWAGSRFIHRRRGGRARRALQAARGVQLDVAGICHLAIFRAAAHSAPEHERCLSLFYRHLCRHAALCAIDSKDQRPAPIPEASSEKQRPPLLAWVGIGAIVIAYINIGAYWSNIELAAEAAGLDGDWSAQVIAWSVLLSFVGCFAAMWILKRFDHDRPLLFTFCLMVMAVGLLAVEITAALFVFSVAMFNFLWIFIDVYQMGGVSVADRSGSAAAFIPGAQGLGQTVGPFAASIMLELGWGFDGVFILCAIASAGALVIYTLIYLKYRHQAG